MKAYCVQPPNLHNVHNWPPGSASSGLQVPDIIFDKRIEFLALTNLYLDINEGLLCVTSKSVPGWPPRPPGTRYYF